MTSGPEKPLHLNRFGRALAFTSLGVVIGLVELVLFSWVAHFAGVDVNVTTMTTSWLVAFYALFLVPGVCLLYAFLTIFG